MTERFTLLSERGRGAMGVVWRARDEESGQIVALKLLRNVYADDPEVLERFAREVELARRVHSPHVVAVLGYGSREGTPYLAMEYVEGPSLRERLAEHGPCGWSEARALLQQLAQGLADVHAAGIVHRDVKPSNILLAPDGTAKLSDFGIARGLDLTRVTGTSAMLGTPTYLAPEGQRDARSDLYSLGCVAYELCTGAPPFEGTSHQDLILAHVRTPPDLAKLPPEARPLVGWLLAKDPAARPQDAHALLAALWGQAGVPALAPRPAPSAPPAAPVLARAATRAPRRRAYAGLAVLGLAVVTVGTALAMGGGGAGAREGQGVFSSTGTAPAQVDSSVAAAPQSAGTALPPPSPTMATALVMLSPSPDPAPTVALKKTPKVTAKPTLSSRATPQPTRMPPPAINQITSVVGDPVASPSCGTNGCSAVDFTVRYAYSGTPTGTYVGLRVLPSSADGVYIFNVHVNGTETGYFGYVPSSNLTAGTGSATVRVVWDGDVTGNPSTTTDFVRACMWANQGNAWPEFACVVIPFHYVWIAK